MANRLSRITTRTGDDGSTGLGDGSRIRKDAARIHALGDIDELNCTLGVLLAEALPEAAHALLTHIQHDLFDLGAEVCIPTHAVIQTEHIQTLETQLETLNAALTPLKEFILPGGTRASALAHQARAIARRAERSLVTLSSTEPLRPQTLQYLNRCSDLLFVLARWLNKEAGRADVMWAREKK